jgi:hypothetical protein
MYQNQGQVQWLMPLISPIQEVEIGRIKVQGKKLTRYHLNNKPGMVFLIFYTRYLRGIDGRISLRLALGSN